MPELGILIQMAEFYDVELKEILDGKREDEVMNQELQETLYKVADYNKLEKEKAVKAGNLAFGLTFLVCAAAIIIQLIVMGTLPIVMGETVTLLTGGIAHAPRVTDAIAKRVQFIAPVKVYPGEDEMRALALNGLMVLKGELEPKVYR